MRVSSFGPVITPTSCLPPPPPPPSETGLMPDHHSTAGTRTGSSGGGAAPGHARITASRARGRMCHLPHHRATVPIRPPPPHPVKHLRGPALQCPHHIPDRET